MNIQYDVTATRIVVSLASPDTESDRCCGRKTRHLVASPVAILRGGGPVPPPVSLSLSSNSHDCVTRSTVLIDALYTWHRELNLRPPHLLY